MRWVFAAIILFICLGSALVIAERNIVYPFNPQTEDPADHGLPTVTAQLFTEGGRNLVIWTAPPARGEPTIFYLHGNAGNLANRASRFRAFIARGYGLVAVAYPGSSGSKGWPYEKNISNAVRSVYIALNNGQLNGIPVQPIIYGESIGTAVTIQLVSSYYIGANVGGTETPSAVILEAPFTSLEDVAKHGVPALAPLTKISPSTWRSIDRLELLRYPLLVLHGDADTLIPISQGRQIFERTASTDKTFFEVKGAGHNDVWQADARAALFDFVDRF